MFLGSPGGKGSIGRIGFGKDGGLILEGSSIFPGFVAGGVFGFRSERGGGETSLEKRGAVKIRTRNKMFIDASPSTPD
jgi:hypothetical protein